MIEEETGTVRFDYLAIEMKDSLIDEFMMELDKLLDKYAIDPDQVDYRFDVEG